ncbi:Diacylglycerol pyrophosphate phosphatase 1 [Paramyrothecium foliicola]|nr:Diacylglycerol pyrophosphate phosphatase 1 [Paramyrothecium foliicola]
MWMYEKMADSAGSKLFGGRLPIRTIISYLFDWVLLIVIGVIGTILGNIEPNKRPFSLKDPNISFPFTEKEAVPTWMLLTFVGAVPVVVIAIVSLIFVPGATVPKDTPQSLVWRRKLWELHVGWLGLLLSVASAWFFTSGMKNMFGKPRPDLLSRCQPDLANAANYVVGGIAAELPLFQLYSADICQQTDRHKLDDGFRSYPSGHSSSAAASLIYLSLFLASKFAVTIPFVVPGNASAQNLAAFPSRQRSASADPYEPNRARGMTDGHSSASSPLHEKANDRNARHNSNIQSLRRQAAAPPIYLLVIVLAPFCLAVFIASSRWYDFRHHGFDILFGFIMGTITAIYSFRWYHLPIREGAGWAWAPRSEPRAFWAGVGRLGYAGDRENLAEAGRFHEFGQTADTSYQGHYTNDHHLHQRSGVTGYDANSATHDLEMQNMEPHPTHNRF